ncbi:MAG TPA: strawberry notch C-terminal domain-containing protein, partial [Chitinophagales bacterium]|nr:strawberry notch C-terminal domain-containing protein [Chitinophagales bacterium]
GQEAVEAKDKIYEVFDKTTKIFRDIYNYIKLQDFVEAVDNAVLRKAEELGLDLAPQDEFNRAKGTSEAKLTEQQDFIKRYGGKANKWVIVKKDTNTLGVTTKFHFIENLLLAIKTDFTAQAVLKELQNMEAEYTIKGGKKIKGNRKPVIALRATGENLFGKLNLKNGDSIENDFGVYIRAVVSGVMSGRVVFRKVNNDLFVPPYVLREDGKEHIEEVALYEIDNEDLTDGGVRLNALIDNANQFTSGLPLCPIDKFIDTIQSVQRDSKDRFGSLTPNYVVGEVTGRNYALYRDANTNLWIYKPNERNRSVKGLFNAFNSGRADVLIINTAGSTGGSIQSSETFSDQRQRIMVIAQPELNVSTEVQKRGRVNRSGQVNYPAYLYVLSQLPSEIRKYLSLKKKLRKLDANTSANQTQNSSLVDIKDKNGKAINDIFNIYGEKAFNRFLDDDDNWKFKQVYDDMKKNYLNTAFEEDEVVAGEVEGADLHPFTRELEIHPCDDQEEFYDKMNTIYDTVVEEEKNQGTYQLELDIEDLKASLRSRVVRQMNFGSTEFAKPLFMEDKYCLDRRRAWSKDKVTSEAVRMATKYYNERNLEFIDLNKFHRDLLDDFELEFESYIERQRNEFVARKEPKRDEYMSDEGFNTALNEYQEAYARRLNSLNQDKTDIEEVLRWYIPLRNVVIPDSVSNDENATITYRFGKFIGYNFKDSSLENKYSKGSIHLKFAILPKIGDTATTAPTLEISLGNREGMMMSREIKIQSNQTYSNTTQLGGKTMGEMDNDRVNEWKVNPNARRTVRFLSGNILSGIQLANNMKDIKSWSLVKHTNNDGTISTSIRLDYPVGKFTALYDEKNKQIEDVPIQISLNNPNIIEYLKLTPADYVFGVSVNTLRSKNVDSVPNGKDMMVKNLIKIGKSSNDINTVFVGFFQIATRKKDKNSGKMEVLSAPTPNATEGNNPLFFAPFLKDYKPHSEQTFTKEKGNDRSGYL